jgi:anthranilate phosphoribosyltransferase
MDSTNILSISALVLSAAGSFLAVVNHRRVRSRCCGANLEASLDVETTTPPTDKIAPLKVDGQQQNKIVLPQ